MSYKSNVQKKVAIIVDKKLESYPKFIHNYFKGFSSEKTKNTNFGYIKNLFNWLIKKEKINNISEQELIKVTTYDIIDYFNSLKNGLDGKTNKLSTINTKKRVFNSFWNYMKDNNIVQVNIIKKIPKSLFKDEEKHIITVPTEKQLDCFISNIKNCNNKQQSIKYLAIVMLMLNSGIRSEELVGLDLKDVHLEEQAYIEVMGKGHQTVKETIPISKEAKEYLLKYLQIRQTLKDVIDKEALFISNKKTRFSKSALDNMFRAYSNKTITPHMLRHWYGSELYKRTKDIKLVQERLRHANMAVTIKHYIKPDEEEYKRIINNFRYKIA